MEGGGDLVGEFYEVCFTGFLKGGLDFLFFLENMGMGGGGVSGVCM